MLERRDLIVVEARLPGDAGTGIHLSTIGDIERGGVGQAAPCAHAVATQLGVLFPALRRRGKAVDHLGPLAVPFWVEVPIEDAVRHVGGPDHRAGHHPRDLLPRPGEPENSTREDRLAVLALAGAAGALVGLRIIEDHQAGTHRPAIRPLELHATDAPGDAGHLDDRAAGLRSGDGRKDDLLCGPADVGAVAPEELTVGAMRDALQGVDGEDRLGEISEQQFVDLQLGLQRIEHVRGVLLIGADEADEFAVPVEDRPQAGAFSDRGLAAAARHGEREQAALQDGLLDLGDDAQVIF